MHRITAIDEQGTVIEQLLGWAGHTHAIEGHATIAINHARPETVSSLNLHLVVSDRNVLAYFAPFEDEEIRCNKALEALKVGVIAIQSARRHISCAKLPDMC